MSARIACAGLAAMLIAAALLFLRPPETAGGSLRDFQAYRAAGAAALAARDPYAADIASDESLLPPGAMLPFVGTPAALPFWMLLARLPASDATIFWRAALVIALIALVIAGALLAGVRTPFDLACLALIALAFAPLTSAVALGQTAIAGAAAAALALGLRTRVALWAGAFVAFCFQPNAALGLLAALRRGGALAIGLGMLALYACGAAVRGAGWPLDYAHLLLAHAEAERVSALQYTPIAIARGFGLAQTLAATIAVAAGSVVTICAAWIAWRRSLYFGFAAISCALPFVCGFFHEQDFAALFVPGIFTLRMVPATLRGPALFAVVAIGANWLDIAQSPPALPQDLALGTALIAACLAILPRIDARAVAWSVASATLLGLGTWVAAAHPLPVWPDAMRDFVQVPGATAAQLWHAELAHTGLLAPNPASAVLRLFSLIGCTVLLGLLARASDVHVHHVVERRDAVGVVAL